MIALKARIPSRALFSASNSEYHLVIFIVPKGSLLADEEAGQVRLGPPGNIE